MLRAIIPRKRDGKIAAALLVIAHVALAPPLVNIADTADLVAGFAPLYLWTLFWGSVMAVILLWAARVDAWGITMDQVPPELRDRADAAGFSDADRTETPAPEAKKRGED